MGVLLRMVLSALNSTFGPTAMVGTTLSAMNGYQSQIYSPTGDPFYIDGYHYIDTSGMGGDGQWYSASPNPPYDNEWGGRASTEREDYLNRSRKEFYRQLEEERKKLADSNNNGIPDIHESKINPKTGEKFTDSRDWRPRIDPLTLDLDGDGIETLGVNADNRVLFDHDGDGAKHGTGWVSADDAMLVLDRNNNGTIDNGRELFGDNTQLANGKFAADGFEALADMDSNGDGKINVDDTQFANLRLWRDLNQDGVSQTNELFTLGDYNIASINVAKVENTTTLANGNQIADLGTFTKTDGSTGNMADVNLLNDRFTRQFANTLDTSSVATLPDMQACTGMFLSSGSGAVRDLREAANDATYCIAA